MVGKDYYPFNHPNTVKIWDDNKAILRHSFGHYCGYVELEKESIPEEWHDGNYDAPGLQFLNIHGGITFGKSTDSTVIFGFDCAHSGDKDRPELQDINYLTKMVEQMEEQLLAFATIYGKWLNATDNEKAKILDEIRDKADISEELPGFAILIMALSGRW